MKKRLVNSWCYAVELEQECAVLISSFVASQIFPFNFKRENQY